tara:strand:- start:203 stop:439 length:237 start_codon:yes stop_codon:yes gene_type:complete
MLEFDIATLSELRAEDALQDYYDNIAEELKMAEADEMIKLIEGPVYYGNLEELDHNELVYLYQKLAIEYEELRKCRKL